jgi:hypothetical protein
MSPRSVRLTVALLALGAVLACVLKLPLIWDGGSQLAVTLIEQRPFVYLTRVHTWFVWWPTVWLSRVTENQTVLLLAYGLPFLLAPAVRVAATWWFVRRSAPALVVWSAFGVAASLPGQAFVINDSIWQQTLAWPLILGALVPLTGVQRIAWLALGACQFPHQIGVLLLGMAFVAACVSRQCWTRAAALLLVCLAAAKAIWVSVPAWSGPLFDSYAAQEASKGRLWQTFRTSVVGWTLGGLVPLWLAAAAIVFLPRRSRWAIGLLVLTAVAWTVYAAVPGEWMSAINYRRWVVPIAAPLVLLALIDSRRRDDSPERGKAMVLLAAVFVVVVGLQSITYYRMLGRMQAEVNAKPGAVVLRSEISSIRETVLDHWSLTATCMFLQGRTPQRYVAMDEAAAEALRAPSLRVHLHEGSSYPATPGPGGWFDHTDLVRRLPQAQ